MKIDEKALRAAEDAIANFASYDTPLTLAEDCITAYLTALTNQEGAQAAKTCPICQGKSLCDPEFCTQRGSANPPAPDEAVRVAMEALLDTYDAKTEKLPSQHENPARGASTYSWRKSITRELRDLIRARKGGGA